MIFQPSFVAVSPLLLLIAMFCVIPLLKSNRTYSPSYLRVQSALAVIVALAVVYIATQLLKDILGIACTGLMGIRITCVESMGLSFWGIGFFVSVPVAIICIYGMFTQLRLSK